jgi:hypothetical protein
MKRLFIASAVVILIAIAFSTSTSYSKTITMPNGDVYNSACGRIWVGQDIYYWIAQLNRMVYAGRVVSVVQMPGRTIVWLRLPGSKRAEPRTRKAICDWGWVKVKEANK